MSWTGWLLFIIAIQVIHFLGTWKLYIKAGRQAWEAAVPVYNAVVLLKIINRPWWWVFLLFIPIVNLIMFPVIWVETLRSFGRNSKNDTALGILTLGLYIYYINYTQDVNYIEDRSLQPRTASGEWISSALFAIVAATIVHTYFMQPFTIPTSSLEKTLLVGDFLLVSKFHYGARTPITTTALPMLHDQVPVLGGKTYLPHPQLPYFRLPGFQDISRNDIVVFNWPVDEYQIIQPPQGYMYKPVDKKSNYVKRCVGIPGDSLSVVDGYVYINGKKNELPDRAKLQFAYYVYSKNILVQSNIVNGERQYDSKPIQSIIDRYQINDMNITGIDENTKTYIHVAHMTDDEYARFKHYSKIDTIVKIQSVKGERDSGVFPKDKQYDWNTNQFGPIYIPEAGVTVEINEKTIPLYRRIIEVYEGSEIGIDNKVTVSNGKVSLNGSPLTSYTFKQNYYWMMGDNRNNSQDARSWGYVPFNHVVGKPVFVWFSLDYNAKGILNKVRWDRLFTTVKGDGATVSYFKFFLIGLAAWFGFNYFRKRKKAAKES